MPKSDLKYYLELIDDDSEEIQNEIFMRLYEYGFELEDDLVDFKVNTDTAKMRLVLPILEGNRRKWIKENWNSWFNLETANDKIESALSQISRFHYGINNKPGLNNLLDELAEEFMNRIPYGDELDLSFFLFKEKMISGSKENYNNPFNSNPVYAIKEKKGLPITLSLIYILVGSRLGFDIKACNYPGHFMAKFDFDGELIIVDCFANGKIMFETDIENLLADSKIDKVKAVFIDSPPELIIQRILNNLIKSYSILNNQVNVEFFTDLAKQIIIV